jgi:spore photoproduct lyase
MPFQRIDKVSGYGTEEYPNILYYFDKTPESIVCPHFWELRWAYGCYFDCSYCYLQGTFRGNKKPRIVPVEDVLIALESAFEDKTLKPSIFNSGELSDSLIHSNIMQISDKFEEQSTHKLLLLTKSTNVTFLLEKLRRQTIVSFSINTPEVWRRWEHKTPSPQKRIEAARKLSQAGYEVRIRIDPVFLIEDWRQKYKELIEHLLSAFSPERIILGTPRGLQKTFIFSKDRSWTKGMTETTQWGKKYPEQVRVEIYSSLIEELTNLGFDKDKISLCKETVSLNKQLKTGRRCNCIW